MTVFRWSLCAVLLFWLGGATLSANPAQETAGGNVEEVYVFRSIRTVRTVGSGAAEFCQKKAGFIAFAQDTSDLVSVAVDSNGLVTEPKVKIIGRLVTCTGRSANPDVFDFYGEGEINGIRFSGGGDCIRYADAPLVLLGTIVRRNAGIDGSPAISRRL